MHQYKGILMFEFFKGTFPGKCKKRRLLFSLSYSIVKNITDKLLR